MVVGIGTVAILVVVAFLFFAPKGGDFGPRDVPGPPEVRAEVVTEHAAQFDDELPKRTAGSQQEQGAATYILGIMQRNGYVVRLESVPVRNLVASTNLIATPPGLDEPETVIVVPYDVTEGDATDPSAGSSLGVFLETARALNVADPEQATAWVALGAESADAKGGHLGSRRLIRFMLDEDWDPHVIQVAVGFEFATTGESAEAFEDAYREVTGESPPFGKIVRQVDPYGEAGFTETIVTAPADVLGPVLLEILRSP